MQMFVKLVFVLVVLGLPGAGFAQSMGKITAESQEQISAYRAMITKDAAPLDKEQLRKILVVFFADGGLSKTEIAQMRELFRTDINGIDVFSAGTKIVSLPPVAASSRSFYILLSQGGDLNVYWNSGAQGIEHLVDYASLSLAMQNNADKIVANQIYAEWKISNSYNQYKPYRSLLADKFTVSTKLLPADHEAFKQILYRANKLIDDKLNDKLPDYLYTWLLQPTPKK